MRPSNDDWRAAWLRGVAVQPGGPHALVSVAPGQILCVPLPEVELADWQGTALRRVWVNLRAQPMRLAAQRPTPRRARHD